MQIQRNDAGFLNDQPLSTITLENSKGLKIVITNYGGIVMGLYVPDANGNIQNIVAGFDTVEAYFSDHPYFGCIVGRYANRIAKGRFSLENKEYQLATNNGPNHLHGGEKGFDKRVWNVEKIIDENDHAGVVLSYVSVDGEEGYPGNLKVAVTYTLNEKNEWRIQYEAITDATTIINLTNHSYFNLSAFHSPTIEDHLLQINADSYLPADETSIPTGEIKNVENTAFDFRESKRIGNKIYSEELQNGFDHNFIISNDSKRFSEIATVLDPVSKRQMKVYTDQPGVQFYSGNFLDGTIVGSQKTAYPKHATLCLETQHFPDSPNRSEFPSVILRAGEIYKSTTMYHFSVAE
jgi:aldose 1-epimerase